MDEAKDMELVQEYACHGTEEAFATIVRRHVNMVYSVALRQVGNPQQAQDVTQAVFVILARKASHLSGKTILSGWLFRTARLTSVSFVRGEVRRQRREREASLMSSSDEEMPNTGPSWERLSPMLDIGV